MNIKFKKITAAILIGICAIIVMGGIYWKYYNSLYLSLNNKNEIMDISDYVITGDTNSSVVYVEINNQKAGKILSKNGKFEYTLVPSGFKQGWNYISFTIKRTFPKSEVKTGGAINVIKNQPDVFLPDLNLFDARINGNNSNYKNFRSSAELYYKGDYHWDAYYFECFPLEQSEKIKFDNEGVPMFKYGESYEYNPVTIAQEGLGWFNRYLSDNSNESMRRFLNIADWLVMNQEQNGSYPYNFVFPLKPNFELPKGFVSGMAQGQILSCLVRAYNLTYDKVYLEAGYKALQFMLSSGDNDIFGRCSKNLYDICKSNDELAKYSNYQIFEEYVSEPASYVLNGDLFALIGIYDWWQGADIAYGKEEAKKAFKDGIKSIEILLPYYDYYGWSSYDLLQYTYESSPYFTCLYAHHCHVYLLNTLGHISHSEIIKKYRDIFLSYVNDDFWRQTNMLYKGN